MCGIAGFADRPRDHAFSGQEPDLALVHAMCDVIRHRGPDDEGIHVEHGVGLGMRRLSIIDLSTGHQPIHNEDGTVWIVFNGEIYNYRELRSELQQVGHRFYTSSDTETIVHAYEQWGEQAFGRLRGMFGLAIWDRRRRTLLVARDRAGIKPVYYAERAGRLYFGSEIKSLLVAGAAEHTLDLAALDHYLTFLYTPREGSIFRGVHKLPPGHYLRWCGGHTKVEQYWELSPAETFAGSDADAADRLYDVLKDAVRSHLISDVPLGAFLSGGIDSSLVVGLMAEVSDRPVRTFSIGFDEPQFDELDHARRVAAHFRTDHHEFVVRPDALAILDRLIQHFDEPFADPSAIPTWYVCEMARRHVTVVLSGDGGDELFGGYDRYLPHPRVAAFDRLPIPHKQQLASAAWRLLPHGTRGKNFLRHVSRDDRGRFLDATAFFQPDEKRGLYAEPLKNIDPAAAERRLAERFQGLDDLPFVSQMMKFDFRTYLPEDVLVKVDRMSMAHSIESRVPLLDNHVIDFAATLPLQSKIHKGVRKVLLKAVASRILPPDIINRRKQGFGVPVGVWFRGSLRDTFSDVLRSQRARERGYFNQRFIDRLLAEHLTGVRDHSTRLWQLVVLELWHQAYVDAPLFVPGTRRARVTANPEPTSAVVAHAR
jgi:asparagine synthase (glutamine-hydrolysing)